MKKHYEIMKSDEKPPLSTYKKMKIVTQIQVRLCSDLESHVEVLSTILKEGLQVPHQKENSSTETDCYKWSE